MRTMGMRRRADSGGRMAAAAAGSWLAAHDIGAFGPSALNANAAGDGKRAVIPASGRLRRLPLRCVREVLSIIVLATISLAALPAQRDSGAPPRRDLLGKQ